MLHNRDRNAMNEVPFRPISDKALFPILAAGHDLPCAHLMGCDCLSFLAPANPAAARSATSQEGVQWHLYGDARWRESAVWVEFVGYFGPVGILTLLAEIPVNESDPFEWAASNLPIQHLFPSERSEMAIQQRAEMLRRESASS